ncbi:MAG: recombinase family protein [Planctomycetes bacterium]|nr:recombinase family protein [Planctomycetota bacterium]
MKIKQTSRALGYMRVSTEGQARDGVSLDAQEAKIKAYCELNGLTLARIYADEGLSGKRADNRPALQEALSALHAGKADALIVYKLDRLARCTIDALEIAKSLDKRGASLHSLTEKLDTGSAMGRFFFTLVASLAEMERGIIAERTAAAHAHKRSLGEATGHAPFGWKLAADGSSLEADENEQETLSIIERLQGQGESQQAIVDALNRLQRPTKQGGTWQRSNLRSVLSTLVRRIGVRPEGASQGRD